MGYSVTVLLTRFIHGHRDIEQSKEQCFHAQIPALDWALDRSQNAANCIFPSNKPNNKKIEACSKGKLPLLGEILQLKSFTGTVFPIVADTILVLLLPLSWHYSWYYLGVATDYFGAVTDTVLAPTIDTLLVLSLIGDASDIILMLQLILSWCCYW